MIGKTEVVARGTFKRFFEGRGRNVAAAVQISGQKVLDTAKELAPKDSGDLARGLYLSKVFEVKPGVWRIEIKSPSPYAAAQERGSGLYTEARPGYLAASRKPILIAPIHGKMLSFQWRAPLVDSIRVKEGFTVYLPTVEHPGVPPTFFMRNAVRQHLAKIWTRIRGAVL